MEPVLLISALVAFACVIMSHASDKFGVPALLIFLGIGIVFGVDGLFGLAFSDFVFTEHLCTVGLIFIMFYGGFGTSWKHARPIAFQATLLSSLGTILTALIVAGACYLLLGLSFIESFLLGAVISSTDAASVFSILRQKRLNLKGGLASLLEVESGSNDPFAYLLTIVGITLMSGEASVGGSILIIIQQIGIGLAAGFGIASLTVFVLKRISFGNDGLDTIFIFAVSLFSYGLPAFLGGNGFLSVYLAGIIIGNSHIAHKIELVHFFDGLTKLSQIAIFFIFGLLAYPSRLSLSLWPALIAALVLTFVARPLAGFITLKPFGRSLKEVAFVSVAGLRGAASLVFAVIATSQLTKEGAPLSFDLFHTIFWVVIFSIALQGSFIAFAAKKLDLVDDSESVMKTFNDYQDEGDFSLIEFEVKRGGNWEGRMLKDLELPRDSLAVLVKRGKESFLPQGTTLLQGGDIIVLNTPGYQSAVSDLELTEYSLVGKHPWINRTLAEISLAPHALVVLIKRGDGSVIPNGKQRLQRNDILVVSGNLPKHPADALRTSAPSQRERTVHS